MIGPALLFCPADRPDRYQKALDVADTVILDLEDAVAPGEKEFARSALIDYAADENRVIVRVNPTDDPEHSLDLLALAQTKYRTVMLAKTESGKQLDHLHEAGFKVLALCETVLGIERGAEIAAHPAVFAMMWGAEDLIASLGGRSSRLNNGQYRDIARYARAHTLMSAKSQAKLAIDAVHLDISDLEGLRDEVLDAVASGFDATACIHPSQVTVIRRGYASTPDEIRWAESVLAEAERQTGVFAFNGMMVDEPVLRQARAILR